MPDNATVVFTPGSLPVGYCPATLQEFYNKMFALATGYLPGTFSTFVTGNSVPAATDQGKSWIRLNGDGSLDKLYTYQSGYWSAPNPTPANNPAAAETGFERRIWVGPLVGVDSLENYDGGAAGAVTDFTGPMWEVDSDFSGRVPVGVGTIPDTVTAVTVGSNQGVGVVTLTTAQLPATLGSLETQWNSYRTNLEAGAAQWMGPQYGSGPFATPNPITQSISFTNAGGGQSHTNVQPSRGVYFIKRTARKFYTV